MSSPAWLPASLCDRRPGTVENQAVALVPNSFLFLVVRPGAPLVASLLLVAMPFVTSSDALVPNPFSSMS